MSNVFEIDAEIVIVKLINGDLIIAKNLGYDEDNSVLLQDPLVVTATSGYLLLTDYVPFLTAHTDEPILRLNPASPIYMEPVGPEIITYYQTCLRYRNMIKEDIDKILLKSHQLIIKTMNDIDAERKASGGVPLDVQTLADLMNTPIASMMDDQVKAHNHGVDLAKTLNEEGVSGEQPQKVVDFSAILQEAMRKKKDPLN